jgi:chromosome segregation ATPase
VESREEQQIRDAVIKLETKMEVMSDSMVSLANSVEKLADIKYEIISLQKDIGSLDAISAKRAKDINNLWDHVRELEKSQQTSNYVIGKFEVFLTAIITGSASFLWWLLTGE